MSWSIMLIGHPDKVVAALETESTKLSGKSKDEFDAALPHLVGLVRQNYNSATDIQPVLSVQASGHGYENSEGAYNNCIVTIQTLAGVLV